MVADLTQAQGHGRRWGIQSKLMMAFGVIAGLTVISGLVGWMFYRQLGDKIGEMAANDLPALASAARIAEGGAGLTAISGRLNGANSEPERAAIAAEMNHTLASLDTTIAAMRQQGVSGASLDSLAVREAEIAKNLADIDKLVARRLAQAEHLGAAIDEISRHHNNFQDGLRAPLQLVSLELVDTGETVINRTDKMIAQVMSSVTDQIIPLFELQAMVNDLVEVLTRAQAATNVEAVDEIWQQYAPLFSRMLSTLSRLRNSGLSPDLVKMIEDMVSLGSGDQDVFTLLRDAYDKTRPIDVRMSAMSRAQEKMALARQMKPNVLELIRPTIAQARTSIIITGSDLKTDTRAALENLVRRDIVRFQSYQDLNAAGNLLTGLLNEAANTNDDGRLALLRLRFRSAASGLAPAVEAVRPSDPDIADIVTKIIALGSGDGSIYERRAEQLRLIRQGAMLLETNRELSKAFAAEVEKIVAEVRTDSEATTADASNAVVTAQTWQAVIAGSSLIAAILIVWLYVGRSIVNRLTRMAEAMRLIASGKLDTQIPAGGHDEISEMAGALTVFRDTAREVEEANKRTEQERVRASAERRRARLELADSFEQTVQRVVEQVIHAVGSLRQTAEGVSRTADQTSREANIAASASEQASVSVRTVAAAAEELSSSIAEIARQVNQSAGIASRAVQDAERTDHTVQTLNEAAGRIGEVVALISQIAEQTNLLALNATIEAARAGDAGRGFAVVASEVKNLASQTAQATEEIGQQIQAVQSTTRDAVGAIRGIRGTIEQINEISTVIAAAVEEQGAATREIARNVSEAAKGTAQASTSIVTVSNAAGETGESAGVVLNAAETMSGHADALSTEVHRFLDQVRA